jgi:hypothetical protein
LPGSQQRHIYFPDNIEVIYYSNRSDATKICELYKFFLLFSFSRPGGKKRRRKGANLEPGEVATARGGLLHNKIPQIAQESPQTRHQNGLSYKIPFLFLQGPGNAKAYLRQYEY